MSTVKMSSPWITYVHQVMALFGEDPDIDIQFDERKNELILRVQDTDKATALSELLPEEKKFSGETIKITVVPANTSPSKAKLLEMALKGNPNFSRMLTLDIGSSNPYTYAIFKKRVAQYWNDNMGDPHGNVSCLYQDLAREVLGNVGGVLYCIDNEADPYDIFGDKISVTYTD